MPCTIPPWTWPSSRSGLMSLSTDPIVVRTSWHNAYAYVTGHGLEVLTEYGRELAPFTMVGMRTVSVEIIATERISSDSFLIRWSERSFENGLRMSPERFTGVFDIVFCRPASPEAMIANPLGNLHPRDRLVTQGRTKRPA